MLIFSNCLPFVKYFKLNKFLWGIIFGLLIGLIVVRIYLIFLPFPTISFTQQGSLIDAITAFSTLCAVLVALSISIWGDWLKSMGSPKSNIQIVGHVENIQENRIKMRQGQTRLIFENKGQVTANEVEVYVNNIYDNNVLRQNFIAVPLSWTHDGHSRRNFHPNQFGYLDLCRIEDLSNPDITPDLVLVAGEGIPSYQEIKPITNKLELVVFQQAGGTKKFLISISWVLGQDYVKVIQIQETRN